MPLIVVVSIDACETLENTMPELIHLTMEELQAGLDQIRQAPKDQGTLDLIVRRPAEDEREILDKGQLDLEVGLVGDTWPSRQCPRTDDGSPHPDMQLNIMGTRAVSLIAQDKDRWPLAGDQLYIDMDLTKENLPAGTRLQLGTAIIEVTAQPHTGCKKFIARFGRDAMKFVNSTTGKDLCLRGINAKVIQPGTIKTGDIAKKLS